MAQKTNDRETSKIYMLGFAVHFADDRELPEIDNLEQLKSEIAEKHNVSAKEVYITTKQKKHGNQ